MPRVQVTRELPDTERETLALAAAAKGPLIAFGRDGFVTLQDAATGRWLGDLRLSTQASVSSIVFDAARSALFAGTDGHVLARWSLGEAPCRLTLKMPKQRIPRVSCAPDGRLLAVSRRNMDRLARSPGTYLHDALTLQELWHDEDVNIGSMENAFSPDGLRLLTFVHVSPEWRLRCLDVATRRVLWEGAGNETRFAWAPDGRHIAGWRRGYDNDSLALRSADDGADIGGILGPLPWCRSLRFDPTGSMLVGCSTPEPWAWAWSFETLRDGAGILAPDDPRVMVASWRAAELWQHAEPLGGGEVLLVDTTRSLRVSAVSGRVVGEMESLAANCVGVSGSRA